ESRPSSRITVALIWVPTFFGIFQDLAGLRIDANFVSHCAVLYVEGVAESAASLLLLQLLIGDGARTSLQRDCARLIDGDLGFRGRLLPGVGKRAVSQQTRCGRREQTAGEVLTKHLSLRRRWPLLAFSRGIFAVTAGRTPVEIRRP